MHPVHWITSVSLFVQLVILESADATEPGQCCYAAYKHQCKNTCERIFRYSENGRSSGITARQITRLTEGCPQDQTDFWTCINETIPGDHWVGRRCCEFALSSQCRNHCLKAKSREDLRDSCRLSDEVAVLRCVDRQEEGQRCCRSTNSKCTAVCKRIFYQDSVPSTTELEMADQHCEQAVLSCIPSASTVPNNINSIRCCNQSDSLECRTKCQEALKLLASEPEIIDAVSEHCGSPNVAVPLWQCFLRTSTNNLPRPGRHEGGSSGWGGSGGSNMGGGGIEVTGIDSAKLQCCDKAATDKCKELCKKTYSKEWTENVGEFHTECMSFNTVEYKLSLCLEDVEDQCVFGCSGLNFCTNFNNRPTTLFRSCTREADERARTALQIWKQGVISLPNLIGFDIPVKNISVCQPNKWNTIACALHVRPCHSQGHNNWICKSDCIDILSECLDTTRLPRGVTAATICDELSPPRDPNKPCISLSTYLVESPYFPQYSEVTQPCSPNPCNGSQVCEVRRRKCSSRSHRQSSSRHQTCQSYVCRPGCPMGEVASQLVPQGAYVRIPETGGASEAGGSSGGGCYKMCMCGGHGNNLHHCVNGLGCSPPGRSQQCLMNSGRIYDHGSLFEYGCNLCVCHSTRTSCTNRYCTSLASPASSSQQRTAARQSPQYTGLPCNCPNDFSPVCAQNGQTFPNDCIARCTGGFSPTDVERGACVDVDPCRHNPCSAPEKCVKHPRVCLGRDISPTECPQYDCIQLNACARRHSGQTKEYLCDTNTREHNSICSLLHSSSSIDYWDHCRSGCEEPLQDTREYLNFGGMEGGRVRGGHGLSTVCAVGGDTFRSECSAWGHGKLVDYLGPCRAVGQLLDYPSLQPRCINITCPALEHHKFCQTTTPPGACCPICAGEIRLLVNEEPLNEIRSRAGRIALTMEELLSSLSLQISMAECDVFGYPTIENDIVILVAPITKRPTKIQVEACMSETAKLASLLTSRSPLLTTFIPIHVVTMTTARTSSLGPLPALLSSGATRPLVPQISLIFLSVILLFVIIFTSRNPVVIIQSISLVMIVALSRLVITSRPIVDTVHLVNR